MTFSIIARCKKTGQIGGAVSSSSPAVASRCLHSRAGIGMVMSQNITDPILGTKILDMLQQGNTPESTIQHLVEKEDFIQYRQLVALNNADKGAVFSGEHTLGVNGYFIGEDVVSAGNLLDNTLVPQAIAEAFEQADGPLAERLLIAMKAGLSAGGEAGPVHSVGLMVMAKDIQWPIVDLRIDWSENPIDDLSTAWEVYAPQMDDYITRAVNPTTAPSYGVPGDL
ncbi:MAG: DUF1028 domain-containing protein [Psychrobacter sp.]|uniref:DUF1028 domain-containing protein n=1 Tax=unclassified Psychrobacter TaxID=196806 RepID=UPI001866D072|nr:DUF1028 domain-containing protein [Psychrobacter sp. FME61]